MIDGTAIKELDERFACPHVVDGHANIIAYPNGWSLKDASAIVEAGPKASTLQVATLGAVRDYLKANRDGLDLSKVVVHVASPRIVKVLGPLDPRSRVREVFVEATAVDLADGFVGQFQTHENFIIGLQTRFDAVPQRDDVLRLLSGIKDEKVKTSMDDGISQVVTARAGTVIVGEVAVPNPVRLAPFRTFRDVRIQPSSIFVLRVQGGREGSLPAVAVFEADGGAWRLDAVGHVHDWLTTELDGTEVEILA